MYRYDRQVLISVAREGFTRSRRVRFQDVDAAGVIFFAAVFEYCHDLYVEYLDAHGVSLVEVLKQRQWAAPIRHAEADYLQPLRFGDEILVSLPVAHLDESELTLGYRITLAGSREVAVVAQSVHTFVALPDFKRCPIPEGVFMAFQPLV
ncbi:MAG TPA: thioesterase family protein [Polyangiaceae bacterium]|nr:thioesterase family protein [Polyangiaceae bacterium]